jgi:bleomycin hydrolase
LYTVYWEYVEKARRYVNELGNSVFEEGSMGNHIPIIWQKYGIVPADAYNGMDEDQPFHNHEKLYKEMRSYLDLVKETKQWQEDVVLNTIKSILNYHLGKPPTTINVNGKSMTPLDYFKKVIRIDFNNYIDILSILEQPYYQNVLYDVPDNWWRSEEYHNVPLDKFIEILKYAIRGGFTLAIGGDVSEPGYNAHKEVAMIPTFDIPSENIDEHARQLRFSNGATTDDHGIHLVGYLEKEGKDWFLIKDSGSGSRNGPNVGYYFYHEDYIKLKMMDYTVHKDALKGIVNIK